MKQSVGRQGNVDLLGSSRGAAHPGSEPEDDHDDLYASVSDPFNQAKFAVSIPINLQSAIDAARQSGRLNCANMDLRVVPDAVYAMYKPPDAGATIDFASDAPRWYDYVDLEHFCAADNEITAVDDRLVDTFAGILTLDLHHNRLASVPSSFMSLERLATLNLAGNELTAAALDVVLRIPTLVELDVSSNMIETPREPLRVPAGLVSLDMSRNSLVGWSSDWLQGCGSLRQLRLADCQLETFDVSGLPSSLVKLDVSGNKLQALTLTDVGAGLVELNVSANRLTSLRWEVTRGGVVLCALQRLDASTNRLCQLDDATLDVLGELEYLDLSQNSLESLPSSIGHLTKLRHLNVAGNDLTELDSGIGRLQSLKHLEWKGNRLGKRYASTTGTAELLQRLRFEGV